MPLKGRNARPSLTITSVAAASKRDDNVASAASASAVAAAATDGGTTMQVLSLGAGIVGLVVTLMISGSSAHAKRGDASETSEWLYLLGDRPMYRLLFLALVVLVAHTSFPAAMMLALAFMCNSTLVPTLANAEAFIASLQGE